MFKATGREMLLKMFLTQTDCHINMEDSQVEDNLLKEKEDYEFVITVNTVVFISTKILATFWCLCLFYTEFQIIKPHKNIWSPGWNKSTRKDLTLKNYFYSQKVVFSRCQTRIYYENIRPLLLQQFKLSNIAEKGHVVLCLSHKLHFIY
jgi:hypothetical protein